MVKIYPKHKIDHDYDIENQPLIKKRKREELPVSPSSHELPSPMEKSRTYEIITPKSVTKKHKSFIPTLFKLGRIAIKLFIINFTKKIGNAFYQFFHHGPTYNKNALFTSKKKMEETELQWNLNLALLRDAYAKTESPALKKQIRFLATNYMAKVAPLLLDLMKLLHKGVNNAFNMGPLTDYHYHRISLRENPNLGAEINKDFALKNKSPLILTDTHEIDHLFPLYFSVVKSENFHEAKVRIFREALEAHLGKYENPKKALSEHLKPNILIDLTSSLASSIKTNGDPGLEAIFKMQLAREKNELNLVMKEAIEQIALKHPIFKSSSNKKKLQRYLQNNTTGISRVTIDSIGGMKVIPVFSNVSIPNLIKKNSALIEFVDYSGVYLGAINLRKHVIDLFSKNQDVQYAVKGNNYPESIPLYPLKDSFTSLSLFKRLSEKWGSVELEKTKPHFAVLGKSTLQLIEGLLNDVTDKKWEELNKDPASQEIIQITLRKLQDLLATAELHADNYNEFAKTIELAHAELSTLLELMSPYEEKDFSAAYSEQLTHIPASLKSFVKVGLGKAAMSTMAEVNAAEFSKNPNPNRAYSKSLYFEHRFLTGNSSSFEEMMADPNIKKIDQYCTQFNSSIDVDQNLFHYAERDIGNDIDQIFDKKPDTEHLTVVVDITIDMINSKQVHDLLNRFKEEIRTGKINFVFLKSGMKLDMFGMDNYYAAPYYIVNNGAPHWEAYNDIPKSTALKADNLSRQWFTLTYKHATPYMDKYRGLIFNNAREILKHVPKELIGKDKRPLRVATTDDKMVVTFIDIKLFGSRNTIKAYGLLAKFYRHCLNRGVIVNSRSSFGFFHATMNVISVSQKEAASIRIVPSINPEENKVFIEFLDSLKAYNP